MNNHLAAPWRRLEGRAGMAARPARPRAGALSSRAGSSAALAALLAALPWIGGCAGGGGSGGSSQTPGTIAQNPATGLHYVVESHQGGSTPALRIQGIFWGRLVDVFDFDPATQERTLRFADYLIGDDIKTDGIDYLLDRNPVTEKEQLVILHPFDTAAFLQAFGRIDTNLQVVLDKGVDPGELPPFTMVPRNAAIVIAFNDVLADGGNPGDPGHPDTVISDNLKVQVGYPPETPYELRVIPDPNHGDIVGGTFHSTRAILDMTVSKLEAQLYNLPINALGLPEAAVTNQPNVALRIPTRVDPGAGQFSILTSLGGSAVAFNGNGHNDPTSPSLDVVRGLRSGGRTSVTGDPNNGFLIDEIPPEILGSQPVVVANVTHTPGGRPEEFTVDVQFQVQVCASAPTIGDVFELSGFLAEVTSAGGPPNQGVSRNVGIKLLFGDPDNFGPVGGLFRTAFDSSVSVAPGCFLRFTTAPAQPPTGGVKLDDHVIVTFSEPMDPASVQAFDTFLVEYDPSNLPMGSSPLNRLVVGRIRSSIDLREFSFVPEVDLRHSQGATEPYHFSVVGGVQGVTDLAGNALKETLPAVTFTVEASQPSVDSAGLSLRFTGTDEDQNGVPELRGQLLFDLGRSLIRPRPVQRFSAVADGSQTIVGAMQAFSLPIQTPLSNLGSKMMTVWRYHDVGFDLLGDANHNLDVEGLNWAPFDNGLVLDHFPEFRMALAHSKSLPDEVINSGLLPNFPQSGLVQTFADNPLEGGLTIVHPKSEGYQVLPLDVFTASSGTLMAPWPMNRNKPISQFRYFTWRDNSVLGIAGPNGIGADTARLEQLVGTGSSMKGFYPKNKVPTIGLPLLMEFRTYSSGQSLGLNGFQIALALNSSALPAFRAFSTGGIPPTGVPRIIDPDSEPLARGGINPNNGQNTRWDDNSLYYGQADFVVKVSRAHTVWFDTQSLGHEFAQVVAEPTQVQQPSGTRVVIAVRGATQITTPDTVPPFPWEDATLITAYGDAYTDSGPGANPGQLFMLGLPNDQTFTVNYIGGTGASDNRWWDDFSAINLAGGARYLQVRLTFLSNPETGLGPELSALGLAYFK